MAGEHILIVDDEPAIRSTLRDVLEDEGYRVSAVGGGADALRFFADELPEVTFLDIWMGRMDGLETLAEIKRARPEAVVVMISGHGTIETAIKATRLGAYDFVEKPLSLEKILVTVSRALEHARLERENAALRASFEQRAEIVGESAAIRALRDQIATAAPTTGRVLIHGERGGGKDTLRVDVRVIAASNRDLAALIREGQFREDLYYRLNVIPIEVPALRTRKDDIPAHVSHFIAQFCAENGKRAKTLSSEALGYFLAYDWPGNVRELRNMVERLVIMAPGDVITAEDLPAPLRPKEASAPVGEARDRSLKDARDNFERAYILAELRANDWNVTRTAERLGIERSHLYRKLKAYHINPPNRDS